MHIGSPPCLASARSRLRWLRRGGLILVAGLLLWFLGRHAVWAPLEPAESGLPSPSVFPPPGESVVVPDRAQDQEEAKMTLYLPAIMVARLPAESAPAEPPLQRPEPRPDAPVVQPGSAAAPTPTPSPPDLAAPPTPVVSALPTPTPVPSDGAASALAGLPASQTLAGLGEDVTPFSSPVEPSPGRWLWPVRGEISQGFSSQHRAIDVVSEQGALVVAADGGTVVYAEWEISGYGYLVIVDHGDEYQTYYAHLYGFYVDVGQRVERGELLGQLGNTGHSTGPHLHFEIRHRGIALDPLLELGETPAAGAH
jgi:murein DD-endopeptidase MepM/ murein hydrolase activator NlpD